MGRPRKSAPRHVEPEDESQESAEPEATGDGEAGGKAISKSGAVRAAIDAGAESPEDGVDFVQKHYGIEVSKPHFSAIKSQ